MINALQGPRLQHRRKIARPTRLQNILDNEAVFSRDKIKLAPNRSRRAHTHQLVKIHGKQQCRLNSLLKKTIMEWNDLPEETLSADTLDTFNFRVPPNY